MISTSLCGISIKVFGFFCDLTKDPKEMIHMEFFMELYNQSFQMTNSNFTYFTKKELDQLFAKDIEDRVI